MTCRLDTAEEVSVYEAGGGCNACPGFPGVDPRTRPRAKSAPPAGRTLLWERAGVRKPPPAIGQPAPRGTGT